MNLNKLFIHKKEKTIGDLFEQDGKTFVLSGDINLSLLEKQNIILKILYKFPIEKLTFFKVSDGQFEVLKNQQMLQVILEFINDGFQIEEDEVFLIGKKVFSLLPLTLKRRLIETTVTCDFIELNDESLKEKVLRLI